MQAAADVMTRTVVTTTAEASIEEVARLMLLHRFSGVPVVDAQGRVIGMITEGDLLLRTETDTENPHSRWFRGLVVSLKNMRRRMHARSKSHEQPRGFGHARDAAAEVVALME